MSFQNKHKTSFLDSIPKTSIDLPTDRLALKCKFNLSYFCHDQDKASNFSDLSNEQLIKFNDKLVHYSKENLIYWTKLGIGNGKKRKHVLEVYPSFPVRSDFKHPRHVPHQACWARFRLEGDARLIGFLVPETYKNLEQNKSNYKFCCNTFYVVFLDLEHNFYK
jgi:hypothetical protein